MFRHAIVRPPGPRFASGITTAGLGSPDLEIALQQHARYCAAFEACGVAITRLAALLDYPDSTFVEDVAIVTDACAILTHPGASSREGETAFIQDALKSFYPLLEEITSPGTVDGGDICQVDRHFLIGISARTNAEGARQLSAILRRHGFSAEMIDCRSIPGLLHLKSGLSYLGENTLVVTQELAGHPALENYAHLIVLPEEAYAANCIRVNERVLLAAGFPHFLEQLAGAGFKPLPLDVSEYQKMDGGLSCLSLRF